MKKVLIIDDHYVVRAGIALILHSNIKNLEIDQVSSYQEALAKIKGKEFDLIILDIDLPDTRNKKMISELQEIANDIKMLMYTAYAGYDVAIQDDRGGGDGVLATTAHARQTVQAINDMLAFGY